MRVKEVVSAYGHKNIRSTHKKTLEITKHKNLTKSGDCIIAIDATKGAADLSPEFKEVAKSDEARITIIIEIDELKEIVRAEGSSFLSFIHPSDLVVRKSDYICSRTVAIRADKAAVDLSRNVVSSLMIPNRLVKITLMAER